MEHIIYIATTLAIGVLIGWKTYPNIKGIITKGEFKRKNAKS